MSRGCWGAEGFTPSFHWSAELWYHLTGDALVARCPCRPGTALGHFRARFGFSNKDLASPSAFSAELGSEHPQSAGTGGIQHFISVYFHISFISSHHLKKSWEEWLVLNLKPSFDEVFLGFTAILVTFGCGKLLIPKIFIKKPYLSLIYRSESAELAAAQREPKNQNLLSSC